MAEYLMGIDYSAYAFYGLKVDEGYAAPERMEEATIPSGFGYLGLGNMMGSGDLPMFLVLSESVQGGELRDLSETNITQGVPLTMVDEDWARHALNEICEANGWEFTEPHWYIGMSIS